MAYAFYVGLDLPENQKGILTVVEKSSRNGDEIAEYAVREIREIDNAISDEQIAAKIQNLIADRPYVGRSVVVVNKTTDRGRRVLNSLNEIGLTSIGVLISGGDTATQTGSGLSRSARRDVTLDTSGFMVSEHDLVDSLVEIYHGGLLRLPNANTDTPSLIASGIESYIARSEEAGTALEAIDERPRRNANHSEYVISTALACWYSEQQHTFNPEESLEEFNPTTGEAKRRIRPDTTS